MKDELHHLIIKGEIEEVIYKLRVWLSDKNSRLLHHLIVIGFGWEQLKSDIILGRLSQESINLEKNKLISNLLSLIESVSNKDFKQNEQIQNKQINSPKTIGPGLSLPLAFSYYYNFLKVINDSLDDKEIQLTFNNYDIKIAQTQNINVNIWVLFPMSDHLSTRKIINSENLLQLEIPTNPRKMLVFGKIDDELITIVDVPSVLYSIVPTYQMFKNKFLFNSSIEQEVDLFIESLQFLINSDETMKSRIKVYKKELTAKQKMSLSPPPPTQES